MTDHLEPFRQLARGIRFAPPLGQHERLNKLVHQPSPLPSAHIDSTVQLARPSLVTPDRGPTPDPSDRAAAIVHAAVSKHTVLPVTNNFQENISDRIDRLGSSKQARFPIVMPKIPAPDPNWVPPAPPPVSQHLVSQTPTPIATAPVEVESDLPQPETPVDSNLNFTPLIETEEVVPQTTEPADLDRTHPSSEKAVPETTESVDLDRISPDGGEIEAVVLEAIEPVDLDRTHSPSEETEDIAFEATESIDIHQDNRTVEADLNGKEIVTQNTETIEIEDISPTEAENSVDLNESSVIEAEKITISELEKLTEEQTNPSSKEKVRVICPECKSREVRKNGRQKNKQKYLCKDCGRQFVWAESLEEQVKEKSEPSEEPKASEITLPSQPIEEPKASEITLPSEPIEEPKASEITLPSEPIEEAKASEITLPSEPIEEAKASEITLPSEPIEEAKASEITLPSKSKKEPKSLPNKSKVSKGNSKQAKGFGRGKNK